MKTLLKVTIIIILMLIPYNITLLDNEIYALTDMYNQWNYILGWTLPISNACVNWTGILCNSNTSVEKMFVNLN